MTIYAKSNMVLHIGRAGEHLATEVVFDISDWINDYGNGNVELIINQNRGLYFQPKEYLLVDNGLVTWKVIDSNTEFVGNGKCELIYLVDDVKVKSAIYDIVVTKTLDSEEGANPPAEPPTAFDSWFDQVLEVAEKVGSAAEDVEAAKAEAQSAKESAISAKQWATGLEEATEEPSNTNNAKYYAQLSEEASRTATAAEESARQYSGNPPRPIDGTWHIWNAETQTYENTYIKVALSIVKSYPSVEAMEADFANMSEGDLVIINSDINEVNNSKLYIHNGNNWLELSDLSGIEGVGIANFARIEGNGTQGTKDKYEVSLTDGRVFTFEIYNGKDGDGAGDMLASIYDSTGAVAAAGGIDKYMQEKSTKIMVQNWTAADLNN